MRTDFNKLSNELIGSASHGVDSPLLQATSDGIVIIAGDGTITFANDVARQIVGGDTTPMVGRRLHDVLHAGPDRDCGACAVIRDGNPLRGITDTFRRADGSGFPVEYNVLPLTEGAEAGGTVIAFRDISRRIQQQQELQRLFGIIEQAPAFISTADRDRNITYVNKTGRKWLGLAEDEQPTGWRLAPASMQIAQQADKAGLWQGERDDFLKAVPGPQPHRSVLQTVVAHKGEADTVEFYSTIAIDITERKRMEERLQYLATHDALTGMMNRSRFQQCLQRELERARQTGTTGAVLYVDLDRFKDINDSLGHHAGDETLRRVARALRTHLRAEDKLARLGGDEFAILLPEITTEDAQAIGRRLLTVLGDEAICFAGNALRVGASIGIATYPEDGTTAEDVLIHADMAMFAAKRHGGNRLSVYDAGEKGRLRARCRLNWEQLCREALQKDRFTLHWQPLLQLRSQQVTAYELLLRMQGADGTLIPPGEFLPVCERSDLIHAIDRWVLGQAIDCLARLPRAKAHNVRLHVNLSRKTFSDDELVPFVRERLNETGVDATRIVLELTETAAIQDVTQATFFMNELRNMGFLFALDDFGVGFSTFGALRRLPVDYLKIDGSFIRELRQDAVNRHLVKAMVEVARGLGKQTVAEFVPDGPTLQLLSDYGVDFGQGYYIGRPEPMDGTRLLLDG